MRKTVELALHARQFDFVFSTARFSFYVGGRGAGKSYAGALRAIMATQATARLPSYVAAAAEVFAQALVAALASTAPAATSATLDRPSAPTA